MPYCITPNLSCVQLALGKHHEPDLATYSDIISFEVSRVIVALRLLDHNAPEKALNFEHGDMG